MPVRHRVACRPMCEPISRPIAISPGVISGNPGRRRTSPGGTASRSWQLLVPSLTLRVLLSFACLAFAMATFGEPNPEGHAGARILDILQDEKTTADQKCLALAKVQGKLTSQEAATVASWLKKAKGRLFVAIARAMERCRARNEALSVLRAVVSNKETPVEQWAPAMDCIEFFWFSNPGLAAGRAMKQAKAALLDRLRHPLDKEQLVAVLRARETLWRVGNSWIYFEKVFDQLCSLLEDDNREVRVQAAIVLTRTWDLQRFSSRAILGLVRALVDASPPETTPVNDLLRMLLGVGPDPKTPEAMKAFWTDWLQKEGKGFRLALHALQRAKSSPQMTHREKVLVARQIAFSAGELPKGDCPKVWAAMRKLFEQDTSPQWQRCSAWLYPLILIASRQDCNDVRGEALAMLLKMSRDKDPILRERALAQIGNLPSATRPGSPSREILDRVFQDPNARPEERAAAAWSLRNALGGNPRLVERMVALGETYQRLPDSAFARVSRTRCIGLVSSALMCGTGKDLSLDPSTWRKALADYLPQGAGSEGRQATDAQENPGRR